MEPTQELIDELFIDKVLAARRRDIGSKFLAGAELFEYGCETMRAGIRMQHPAASPEEVEQILRKRIELGRKIQEALYDSA
jgi:hypothetical protein